MVKETSGSSLNHSTHGLMQRGERAWPLVQSFLCWPSGHEVSRYYNLVRQTEGLIKMHRIHLRIRFRRSPEKAFVKGRPITKKYCTNIFSHSKRTRSVVFNASLAAARGFLLVQGGDVSYMPLPHGPRCFAKLLLNPVESKAIHEKSLWCCFLFFS